MIRALKMEEKAVGSYINLSQGVFETNIVVSKKLKKKALHRKIVLIFERVMLYTNC